MDFLSYLASLFLTFFCLLAPATSLMLKNPKCKAISPSWSLASICIYSGWVFSFILIGAICLQDFCLEMEKKNAANWASERHNSRWITPHKNKYLNERKFYT